MSSRRAPGAASAPAARLPEPHAEFQTLSAAELHALADALLVPEPVAVDRCIAFVAAETQGFWHGRARALMCRRLKHCGLGRAQRTALVACILGRLRAGNFSQQFKEQLRLALHLDQALTVRACEEALASGKPYVRRYGAWALALLKKRQESAGSHGP